MTLASERPVFADHASKSDSVQNHAFVKWTSGKDAHTVLRESLELLLLFDWYHRLNDPVATMLLANSVALARRMEPEEVNNWNLIQELAARLVGASRHEDAKELLSVRNPKDIDAYWAPGWTWRGVAQYRLGQMKASRRSCEIAEDCGSPRGMVTRHWDEWTDIVLAYGCMAVWRAAFLAAERPGNFQKRFDLRCYVIELHSGGPPNSLIVRRY